MGMIYQGTNLINGKRYIGRCSSSLGTRISGHVNKAMRGSNSPFHRAIRKYGRDMFRFIVLSQVYGVVETHAEETRLIEILRPEYNAARGACGRRDNGLSLKPPTVSTGEEWRSVGGYVGLYEVSNLGRIRSIRHFRRARGYTAPPLPPKLMKLCRRGRGGHLAVTLCLSVGPVKKTFLVHRIVAAAFLGPIPDGMKVLHKDDTPANNRVDNLYIGTQAQNVADRVARNRCARGAAHPHSKLTAESADEIRALSGKESQHSLAKRFGVSHTSIWQVMKGITWKKQGGINAVAT